MTTLMEEEPYALAVHNDDISSTCSKCIAWNTLSRERVKLSRCAGCLVLYYCSPKCQKADWKDHKPECKLLRSANFVPCGTARLVLRMIEKSTTQPDFKSFNGRTYDSLMHNSSKRREKPHCMSEARKIYDEICRFKGSKAPDFETVFLALSKKAINAFPIYDGSWNISARGDAVYLGLSVLDHSCRPDAFIVNHGSKMMLRTTKKNLVYSDKLTISYLANTFFMDTDHRRNNLRHEYFFFCECEECKDEESYEKKIAGRPACCPKSWFSLSVGICNNCKQEVSVERVDKAMDAIESIRAAIQAFMNRVHKGGHAVSTQAPGWIKNFESWRQALSDENSLLFRIANIMYFFMIATDVQISCKYVNFCASYARRNPHCVYSTTLFSRRYHYYELANKPLKERKRALNEAIDSVQVVFGPEHDLTKWLLEKKVLIDLENLQTC